MICALNPAGGVAFGIAYRMLRNEALAKDVLMQTAANLFRNGYRRLKTYDPAKASVTTELTDRSTCSFLRWFATVIRNEARRQLRQEARQRGEIAPHRGAARLAETRTRLWEAYRDFLHHLTALQNEAFVLIYRDRLSMAEAGAIASPRVSDGAMRRRVFDAVRKLAAMKRAMSEGKDGR